MTAVIENQETGMELRDLLDDGDFCRRQTSMARASRRFEALPRLARVFNGGPDAMLQKLVDIAVEFCGADSAGISLEEADETGKLNFRWIAIAGSFAKYLHGTTPRFFSPCGTCLDRGRAQLYRVTKPYYDFLGVEADPITDGMLLPWSSNIDRGTIWAVSHHSRETFDVEDYKLLLNLGDFVSIAIQLRHEQTLARKDEKIQAFAAKAHEMAHQINNPLQSLTNILFLASQGGEETHWFVRQAEQEVRTLSALVNQLLLEGAPTQHS